MKISYHWEDMAVNVECDTGDITPHTKTVCQDVDFDYEVNVRIDDVIQYLMPFHLKDKVNKTPDKVKETTLAEIYMRRAIQFLKQEFSLDFDELENDEFFVEFMKDRCEEDALAEWEEGNDAY